MEAPTGGASTGGVPTGGASTVGAPGCAEDSTRFDCSVGREICKGGTWVGDRTCYPSACAIGDCEDGTSTCCEGWGRVALDGYTYVPNEDLVQDFAQTSSPLGVETPFALVAALD